NSLDVTEVASIARLNSTWKDEPGSASAGADGEKDWTVSEGSVVLPDPLLSAAAVPTPQPESPRAIAARAPKRGKHASRACIRRASPTESWCPSSCGLMPDSEAVRA